jgi:hypothetical protein
MNKPEKDCGCPVWLGCEHSPRLPVRKPVVVKTEVLERLLEKFTDQTIQTIKKKNQELERTIEGLQVKIKHSKPEKKLKFDLIGFLGCVTALYLSIMLDSGVWWNLFHGLLGWLYIAYYVFFKMF